MRSDSLVCTMVSSLAPRSSCRSAAMRLRSRSVTCSTRSSVSWVKLCSISAVARAWALSRLDRASRRLCSRVPMLLHQAQAHHHHDHRVAGLRRSPSAARGCRPSAPVYSTASVTEASASSRAIGQNVRRRASHCVRRYQAAAADVCSGAARTRTWPRIQPIRPGRAAASPASPRLAAAMVTSIQRWRPAIAHQELHAGERHQRHHGASRNSTASPSTGRSRSQGATRPSPTPPTARQSRPGGPRAGSSSPSRT